MVAAEERMAGQEIRGRCRTADFTQQTSGLAPGYVQCNIVILPADDAAHFESFCTLNPKPCPLLAVSERPGDPSLPRLGTDIDIRTDVPQYPVSYTHLRAHETGRNLVCRLLLEKKKK